MKSGGILPRVDQNQAGPATVSCARLEEGSDRTAVGLLDLQPATMDSPEQVSNEFRRKLRGEERSRREQLLDSSKIATGFKFRAPLLSPLIQRGFFTASRSMVRTRAK